MDSVTAAASATAPTQRKRRRGWESKQEPLLVSKGDAAAMLSLCVRTIDKLIATKELPARRCGKRVLIPFSALQQFARRDHVTTTAGTRTMSTAAARQPVNAALVEAGRAVHRADGERAGLRRRQRRQCERQPHNCARGARQRRRRHELAGTAARTRLLRTGGAVCRAVEPHTEADPTAILLQYLGAFGNVIGREPHWLI